MKNSLKKVVLSSKVFFALSLLVINTGSYADDTEVFFSPQTVNPNLLFVLDVSNSMKRDLDVDGAVTEFTKSINASGDDASQSGSQFIVTDSNVVTFGAAGIQTTARFRFTDIPIPQGAAIINAYIQFTAASDHFGQADFRVLVEAEDNAPAIVSGHSNGSYYSEEDRWEIPGNQQWRTGDRSANQRADVTFITGEVIDRDDWDEDNAIAFYIESDVGQRTVAAFDHPTLAAPELFIEYSVGETKTRIDALKEQFRGVLAGAPDNVNVGLMNYGLISSNKSNAQNHRLHSVGGVRFPLVDINSLASDTIATGDEYGLPVIADSTTTVRQYLADIADSWDYKSGTPIVDSLYEAALYYRGERMHYGQNLSEKNGAHPVTYTGNRVTVDITDEDDVGRVLNNNSPEYISPIVSECQANYIVLMTDGGPSTRDAANNYVPGPFASIRGTTVGPQGDLVTAFESEHALGTSTDCDDPAGLDVDKRSSGECGAELTHFLSDYDPLTKSATAKDGTESIESFIIGFATDESTETYLKSLATYEDGDATTTEDGFYEANTPAELSAAFNEIFSAITTPTGALASPGYSVNVKNGLEHEKDIYIPVFDRKNTSRWSGNIKKFSLVDINGSRIIQGKNDLDATDEEGNFTANALDYWSTASDANPDGVDVEKGGVANLLDPNVRNIYSNLDTTTNINVSLNSAANKINIANIDNLTNDVLGLPSGTTDEYREKIVSFMRGWTDGVTDANATPVPSKRFHMGDMLHSEPLVLTYDAGNGISGEVDYKAKEQYIFAGTNEGYIHAFDTATGEEKFAFIPADLLSTITLPQFLNTGSEHDHEYGLDGAITGDVQGAEDGVISHVDGDKAIIYFGMRRGGSAYYALDVSDINNPVLLWKKSAADHDSMGQSWSTPYVATVGVENGSATDAQEVVIVSGGYDSAEDRDIGPDSNVLADSTVDVTATVGNDILIFDTITGDKVWSMTDAMRSQITNSIAGGIRPLDTNNNDLIDRIYFGDTGGNVWRLDLNENIGDTASASTLSKLASLGGTGINNRMFFNEPDVALMRLNGRSVYAVSIGSGFRAHPMDTTIVDKFYTIIDSSPFSPLANPYPVADTIVEGDLGTIVVTSSGSVTTTGSLTTVLDTNGANISKRGWAVSLPENGEKVLGDATAVDGSIVFTTFVPEPVVNVCLPAQTYSRLYAVDILTGTPKWNLDGDVNEVPEIFTLKLTSEIISSVDKVYNTPSPTTETITGTDSDGNETTETSCEHIVDLRVGKKSSEVTGYNACRLESVYWSDPVEAQ